MAEQVVEWTKQWEQQGMEKGFTKGQQAGMQIGRQEGRQEGEASVLLRLMERRFGSVDDAIRHRLQTADAETLLQWADRLLTAASPEEILKN